MLNTFVAPGMERTSLIWDDKIVYFDQFGGIQTAIAKTNKS